MNCRKRQKTAISSTTAMTLVELIGVLTVVAVLAGIVLPAALRTLDRIASEREVASLSQFADGFRASILRSRSIGSESNWMAEVASEVGLDIDGVRKNPRRVQRAFLYDKGGWLGTATLPYYQTNSNPPGLSSRPTTPRLMLVSSLGKALPAALNNTSLTAAEFADLWGTADGTLPGTGPWTGWHGDADDVKLERVDLSPLFIHVVLGTYTSTNVGLFRVDGPHTGQQVFTNTAGFYEAPFGDGVDRYFLKGTVLQLYSSLPKITLQHSEILEQDASFVYENGLWRKSIVGTVAVPMGDSTGIVEAFLKAPENINAQNTNGLGIQQYIIVTNFIAYMSNYNIWEDGGFTNTAVQDYLKNTLQPAMMQSVKEIFLWSDKHYPTNNYVPCE